MEIYDVFISYRRSDGMKYAEELNTALTNGGLRVFFDKDKMDSGKAFPKQLKNAVIAAPHYILIGSPDAFVDRSKGNPGEKDFVREEMKLACEYDTDERSIHVLQLPGVDYEEQKGKASGLIMRIFDSTWLEYNDNNKQKVYEEITEISRQNIWYAASRWYGDSKKPGARFHSIDITDTLLPTVDTERAGKELPINVHGENEGESVPLLDAIGKENGHIYLIGEGGIGKTTSLMRIMQESYENRVYSDDVQIPVFVELSFAPDSNYGKIYEGGGSTFIRRMIFRQIRNVVNLNHVSDEQVDSLNDIFNLPAKVAVTPVNNVFRSKHGLPEFLLLLDGLNEVSQVRINDDEHGNPSVYSMVVDEINELAGFDNVQIILTSRMDESAIDKDSVSKLYLSGINDESICGYLGKADDEKDAFLAQKELVETLRNPLFLTMYSKLANAGDITTRGEIMREYFGERSGANYTQLSRLEKTGNDVKEFSDKSLRKRISYEMYKFILDFILPEIAWMLERENEFYIDPLDFEDVTKPLLTDRDDQSVCGRYGRVAFTAYKSSSAAIHTGSVADKLCALDGDFSKVTEQILDICTNTLGILQVTDGKYGFIHQHIRDYFAAVKNINTLTLASFMNEKEKKNPALECMNSAFEEKPVGITVRQFMGEYLGEHRNKPFFDNGKWNYGVPAEKSDRNLLERSLDIYRGLFDGETGYGIYSLIQILKEERLDLSGFDFSNLDLMDIRLRGRLLSRPGLTAKFCGSKCCLKTFMPYGHTNNIQTVNFSLDGTKVVTASSDNTAKVWDTYSVNGNVLFTLNHNNAVNYACYSPDGSKIITASSEGPAKLWSAETGEFLKDLSGHGKSVNCACFTPDGSLVITASKDGTVRVWSAETGDPLETIMKHSKSVNHVSCSADGKMIVSASDDKMIVSASDDKTAKIWDLKTGNCIQTLKNGHTDIVKSASFSPDCQMVVTASADKTAIIWSVDSGNIIKTLKNGHTNKVNSASFSPDGSTIITASNDGTIKVWDVSGGKPIKTVYSSNTWASCVNYSTDGEKLVASVGFGFRIWDARSYKLIQNTSGYGNGIQYAGFSPDDKKAVLLRGSVAAVWDLNTTRMIGALIGHSKDINSVSFSPDGKRIVTASSDRSVRIWDANTFQQIRILIEYSDSAVFSRFSSDGKRIITAAKDNIITVWNANTEKDTYTISKKFKENGNPFAQISMSPDGKRIAIITSIQSSSNGMQTKQNARNAIIRNVENYNSGDRIALTRDNSFAQTVDFSCDGKLAVSLFNRFSSNGSGGGSSLVLWEIENNRKKIALNCLGSRRKKGARISSDGKKVCFCTNHIVKVFNAEDMSYIGRTGDFKKGAINCVEFSKDSRKMLISTNRGSVIYMDLTAKEDLSSRIFDCIWELDYLPGVFLVNCDFTNLHPASSFSEHEKDILKQYGAIV